MFRQLMILVLVFFLMSVVTAQAADVPFSGWSEAAWTAYGLLDVPGLMLGLGNTIFLLVLIRWHVQDGQFDFRRALIDPATNAISFSRLGQLTALVTSTELMIYEAVKGRLSEWFVLAYLGAWAGVAVFGRWQDSQNAKAGVSVPKHESTEPDPKP
jgi:hypothetical protein